MITLYNIEQGTEEWFDLRDNKFTGSNADRLLKWGKRDAARSHKGDSVQTFWMQRGHILEDEALILYQEIRDLNVLRVGGIENSNYLECFYSPDAVTDKLLEVKCFSKEKHLETINEVERSELSIKIMAQIQFGLLLSELKLAELILYNPRLNPKEAFKVYTIKANQKIHDNFKRILNMETN